MKSEGQRISDAYDALYIARCSVCGKRLRPTKNGKARVHKRDAFAGTFLRTVRCPGSSQPAKGIT